MHVDYCGMLQDRVTSPGYRGVRRPTCTRARSFAQLYRRRQLPNANTSLAEMSLFLLCVVCQFWTRRCYGICCATNVRNWHRRACGPGRIDRQDRTQLVLPSLPVRLYVCMSDMHASKTDTSS